MFFMKYLLVLFVLPIILGNNYYSSDDGMRFEMKIKGVLWVG